jgi:hypothetical protein
MLEHLNKKHDLLTVSIGTGSASDVPECITNFKRILDAALTT